MESLQEIQMEIEWIDEQLAKLYQKRMRLTEAAGAHDPASKEGLFGFALEEGFDFTGARVVFQGVEGAYSQQALREFFGTRTNSFHVDTWKGAMEAIAEGTADYAVLPIENSSAGIVSENFDLLTEYDCSIVGEQIIKIDHCLLGVEGASISGLTDVYSHPQALMQCSKYLGEHTDWETHSMQNTAGAAKKVKEDGRKSRAAIAAEITADIYGLQILAKAIQNNTSNSTKFIIVTGRRVFQRNAGKISICFEIPHKSGSLYRTLSHFIQHNLNMSKIESRPIQGRTWEYRFFVDFEGNLANGLVQDALNGLKNDTESLRILGNY